MTSVGHPSHLVKGLNRLQIEKLPKEQLEEL